MGKDANAVAKTMSGAGRIRRLALGFLQSSAGNIAIISALMIPVIVGFCGLVAETSYWYYRHRNVQDAADLAAYSAAMALGRGGDEADIAAIAKADAIANGWRADSGTIEVTQYGSHVEVLLIENQRRYFSRFFCATPTVPIGARASRSALEAAELGSCGSTRSRTRRDAYRPAARPLKRPSERNRRAGIDAQALSLR